MKSADRPPETLIPSLAQIVSGIDGEVVFQISLDSDGSVMDIECLASQIQPKNMLPLDLVLEHPRNKGADSVMFVSNSSGPLARPAESDLDFTSRLIEAGDSSDLPVRDHYLVKDGAFISLRDSTALWG
jgi:DNA repair protein RadC